MSTNRATNRIVVFGISDRGLQRENNEDHFMVAELTHQVVGVDDNVLLPELIHHEIGERGTLLMVADGLGGHASGELASRIAVETVVQALFESVDTQRPIGDQLRQALMTAHEAICTSHGGSGRTRNMASTLTAIHVSAGHLTIAQVGDSRAYRLRHGILAQLTEDQTVVHMMQKKGMLTAEEAKHHPHRNIILQALGQDKTVFPEIQTVPFQDGDTLLLCSDGLSSYLLHDQIEAIMASGENEHIRCRQLVEAANNAGGADNVTVLIARLILQEHLEPYDNGVPTLSDDKAQEGLLTREAWEAEAATAQTAEPHDWTHPLELSGANPWSDTPESDVEGPPADDTSSQPEKQSFWKREVRLPWSGKGKAAPEESSADDMASSDEKLSFWKREIKLPWASKSEEPPVDDMASSDEKFSFWKREIKLPWASKKEEPLPDEPPAIVDSNSAKPSFWKRGIRLPWGGKDEMPQENTPENPLIGDNEKLPAARRSTKPVVVSPWDPQALKAVEECLAEHVGPVAKILVGRAVSRAKTLQDLCEILAAQLADEQEKQRFFARVLPHINTPS